MQKLKLNVEDLEVNSFDAGSSPEDARGTVHGASEKWSAMCGSWDRFRYDMSTWMM